MKGVVNIGEYKEWIPVTEELPKEKGLYVVSIDPYYLSPNDVLLVDIWGWDGEN